LHPAIREQLLLFQNSFNQELRNEKLNVPEHVSHPPFHFDYVDSDIQNALAFRTERHSFIAITVPLVFSLSDVCRFLSKSGTVCTLLGVEHSTDEYSPLHAALFSTVLNFVVSHEFTHHVHGHLTRIDTDLSFRNEILDNGHIGDLEEQIQEIVADGYSIYHVLANLIDGSGRSWLAVLELGQKENHIQNQALFTLAILAVAAYFFAHPASQWTDLYKLTHPPQPVRMNCIIEEALNWSSHNNHHELNASMTMTRIQQIMAAASEAASTPANADHWRELISYLQTGAGARYYKDLTDGVNTYKQDRQTLGG
jgi:hypothetical protein